MVNVDEAFEVRYKKGGEQFEVLVDFDKLKEFEKSPDSVSVYDVLADVKIFRDQKKGEIASDNLLHKVFPEKSEEEIIKEILLEGETQIPTSYLNKLRDEKKVRVINYIAEAATNPATKTRYTVSMIESAVSRIKYNFDPYKSSDTQAEEVLKLLKFQMPISIAKIRMQMKIPAQHSGAFYGAFRSYGEIKKEFYDSFGNLNLEIEITEAQKDKVIDYVKRKTNNEAEYRVVSD